MDSGCPISQRFCCLSSPLTTASSSSRVTTIAVVMTRAIKQADPSTVDGDDDVVVNVYLIGVSRLLNEAIDLLQLLVGEYHMEKLR